MYRRLNDKIISTNLIVTLKINMFKYQNINPFKILKTSCAHTKSIDIIWSNFDKKTIVISHFNLKRIYILQLFFC
jgi:hypothetical protein